MKIIVGITLLILLILLIRNKIKSAVLFGSLAGFYYALGYLDFKTWISSYTNDSLISLMLLLLVSIAVEKTIIIEWASKFIIGKNYNLSLLRLGVITCAVSAFLNNTAVVASFMGIVKNNKFQAPSKLLIPLSYFAIVGGVITLVGTSTNLIINSFVVQNGLPSLKMFDFFYIGIALSIGMILVLMIFSKLLPNYENKDKNIKEHLIALKVLENSSLIGKSIEENKLRNLEFLFLVEIQRNNQSITPVSHNEIINAKDTLIFSGNISQLETLNKFDGLKLADGYELKESKFIDAIISPTSNLIGKSVKEANFRSKFDAAIISLQRGDVYIKKIGESVLQAGDRMILAVGKDFILRDNLAKNFYLLSNIKQNEKLDAKKSLMTIMAFLSVIVFSALNFISFTKALLICLGFLLLCKFIKLDEIKRRFPFDIFIIVGSSLAITKVLVDSGLAKDLAQLITGFFRHYGVYGSFIGVYLLTLLLTEFITNNAAAALAFPIGFATAQALGVNPLPFIFAVAYGASAGFMIPHGYQTHLMVSSLCDYKMTDFIKIGAIVSIVYSAIVLIGIPLIFNF
ncbi:TPA: SLC13 family permease [Campylobacter jejuni]|nr:SLC13 family permease [Campylobacter jejuni]HED0531218.1 SLC13 family permease [Campylobacter jejuni]